jgi:predicted DCC family thiol-disulfide oxidoreductase YuxK
MDEPARPVLIYDGDCTFCTTWAHRVENAVGATVQVVPWQELGPAGLAELGLSEEEAGRASWWIDPAGRRFRGAKSVAKALVALGGRWRPVGHAIATPPLSWLSSGVYAVVVRLRHRLPGGTAACRVTEAAR